MTKDEALKMAIKFMETLTIDVGIKTWNEKHRKEAIQACKEALKQLAQEPYQCHWVEKGKGHCERNKRMGFADDYGRPPLWQGLSDDEIRKIDDVTLGAEYFEEQATDFARAIEQALKEKNANNA